MLTSPYSLKRDYSNSVPVSASDLNRRARVLATQLPGAFRGAALGAGVFPLWDPPTGQTLKELVDDLATQAQSALKVTKVGAQFVASAGAAVIEATANAGSAPLIYTQTSGLSVGSQTPNGDGTLYVHITLQFPSSQSEHDSEVGDPPKLLISDQEQEPGGLLLASYTSAQGLRDRRTFSTPVLLAIELVELRQRLDALGNPVTGGEGETGVTTGDFFAMKQDIDTLKGEFADLKAQIAKLGGGTDVFPAPFDVLADEIALTRSSLAELNPPSIERGQISVVVATAGHGQNSTPDFTPNSPTTGDPLELPWDAQQGIFGP